MDTKINDTCLAITPLTELIKKELSQKNPTGAIEAIIEHREKEGHSYSKQIKELQSEVCQLNEKLQLIEKVNKGLIKEKNFQLVKEYSAKLIDLLENHDYEQFKQIIEEHDYPVDEYISDDIPELSHMNLLHYCIDYGKLSMIKYLIQERKADVNVPDREEKWTPSMYAIQKQNSKILSLLVEKGANLDYRDIDGFTPLSVAVDSNNLEMVKILLKAKPQVDSPKEIMAMAEPYENEKMLDILKDYFGFRLILYENEEISESKTSNTTPTNKLSTHSHINTN